MKKLSTAKKKISAEYKCLIFWLIDRISFVVRPNAPAVLASREKWRVLSLDTYKRILYNSLRNIALLYFKSDTTQKN